ncbi:MAG: EcsC family protein [Lachnospiraceae bacterium]
MNEKDILLPSPIIDLKEDASIKILTDRYEKLVKPGLLAKTGKKVVEIIPKPIMNVGKAAKETISEEEFFIQCMKVIAEGFGILEKQAAKLTVSERTIVKKVNDVSKDLEITSLEEVCLARSYNISKLVNGYRTQDLGLALAEGGVTGYFGFAGLPFNLVLSTFLYYRSVQSVAMYYGYDIKNDPAELVIASDVFMNALSPNSQGTNEITGIIGKIMLMTEVTTVKQLSKKTWEEMAKHGGVALLICQMRALANKTAQKALEKAGQKGLEESLFKGIFEQIGKSLSKKAVGKAIPVAGAVVGALFDTAQMNTVLEYADVFYNKRYLLEKEARINALIGVSESLDSIIIDIPEEDFDGKEKLGDQCSGIT